MNYSEKLKDPRWQKKRLEILSRDSFMCFLCSDETTTLHIHHEEYFSKTDPWDYPSEKLTTLCEHCHAVVEYCRRNNIEEPERIIKARGLPGLVFIFSIYRSENGTALRYFDFNSDSIIELGFTLPDFLFDNIYEEFNKIRSGNG